MRLVDADIFASELDFADADVCEDRFFKERLTNNETD